MIYKVIDDGLDAVMPGKDPKVCEFEDWGKAVKYARWYLGPWGKKVKKFTRNTPVDYTGYGNFITIIEISEEDDEAFIKNLTFLIYKEEARALQELQLIQELIKDGSGNSLNQKILDKLENQKSRWLNMVTILDTGASNGMKYLRELEKKQNRQYIFKRSPKKTLDAWQMALDLADSQ